MQTICTAIGLTVNGRAESCLPCCIISEKASRLSRNMEKGSARFFILRPHLIESVERVTIRVKYSACEMHCKGVTLCE